MIDRILVWLVSIFPVALMVGLLLFRRWKRMGRVPACDVLFVLIVVGMMGGFGAWQLLRPESAETHVFLQNPYALLLAVPVCGVLLWLQEHTLSGISRSRMWLAFLLRSALVVLVALALAGLQMIVERDALTVVFALDVSKSIPEVERQRALDFIEKTRATMKVNDEAGLVVFGGKAATEVQPTPLFEAPQLKDIKSVVESDATNIGGALRSAAAVFDQSSRRRLVIFTDGRQTTGDAASELKRIVSQGIDVWTVPLKSGDTAEMLIEKVVVPSELLWEQVFDAHVYLWSNVHAQATVNLYPGDSSGAPKYSKNTELVPGRNRVTFAGLKMHSGGSKEIRAVLEPVHASDDTSNENNEGFAFTDVQTDSRVLVLTSDLKEVQNLLTAFEGEKIALDVRTPASLPNNPEDYRAYDCIILANLARGFLSNGHMEVIESCVKDQGAGLIMIGGDQSFGAGGYLGTPIEKALPVEMDLTNQRVMPSGALCMIIETCEVPDGDLWGKKITKAALATLSPQDYAGLAFYNYTGDVWAFKPTLIGNRRPYLNGLIDGVETGDIPTLDSILSMVVGEMSKLQNVSLKHCIVIGDGDWETASAATIAKARAAGITISAVSTYPHNGIHIKSMKDLAVAGGGHYYAYDDAKKLPQIFIKEAAIVRKSLIHADDKGIPISVGTPGTTLRDFGNTFPACRAMIVTQSETLSEVQLYTVFENEKIPILATWRYGLGQATAFTTDSSTRWAPEWVSSPMYKKFWVNVLRDCSRKRMPTNHTVSSRIEDGIAYVVIEALDSSGSYKNFGKLLGSAVRPKGTHGDEDEAPIALNFAMTEPGKYEAKFPVDKPGVYAVTVVDQSDAKHPQSLVTGVANSYSAEFAHIESDDFLFQQMNDFASAKFKEPRLKDLAKLDPLTCGVFAHDLPPSSQPTELFPWLLIAALCLFPLDVAVRRLAIDPEKAYLWFAQVIRPGLQTLRLTKRQLQNAASVAVAGGSIVQPDDIVPTGPMSRDAQSRYEQAGESAKAQDLNLDPAHPTKPVVGGTKVSKVESMTSAYTGALLKAKKRAMKDRDA